MRNMILAGAVALALGAPVVGHAATRKPAAAPAVPAATADDVRALRDQLQALADRLQKLEAANGELQQSNAQLKAQNDKLAQDTQDAIASNDAQTDAIAKSKAKVDAADWAGRIKISGDARYRDENIQRDLRTDQTRDRIRARIAIAAKATDTITVGARLATGADDPRSSNQTLGAGGATLARRAIGVDQYYVSWKPIAPLTILGGKFAIPYYRPGQSLLNDGDINPEGVAVNWQHGPYFVNAFGFWLTERGTATINATTGAVGAISKQQQGTTQVGLQLGGKWQLGATSTFQAAVMYTDLGAGQGRQPFWFANGLPTTSTITCNPVTSVPATPSCRTVTVTNVAGVAAAANGNSVDANGNLLYDYSVVQVSAEYATKFGALPFSVWADYAKNDQADNGLDTAYTAGVTLGKASEKNTWEIGYAYEKLEKDAYFGQFVDSDFGAGFTDTKGSIIRFGWAPAKNWTLNATYFINKLNVSGTTAALSGKREEDYKRLQLDFNVKY